MLADEVSGKAHRRAVARHIEGFVMLPGFRASSKAEAIEKMIGEIAKAFPSRVTDPQAAIAAVMKREASMPTGLDHGIAVPHGRDASVAGIVGAVALVDNTGTAAGCIADYETIDNSPVEIIVLTLANDAEQTPYIQLMAGISRILRAEDGCRRLLACKTPQEMRRFFRKGR